MYMLSPSLYHRDRDKENMNKYVNGFISKPPDFDTVISIAAANFNYKTGALAWVYLFSPAGRRFRVSLQT
jgi:hypothetical protein